jgi:hypothetical protein
LVANGEQPVQIDFVAVCFCNRLEHRFGSRYLIACEALSTTKEVYAFS